MASLNVAIIGAGLRAIAFYDFLSKNPCIARLAAIVDTNAEKAKALNAYFKLDAQIATDYNKIIAQNHIDAVIISMPDYAHAGPVVAALKANKHIYLEKPLATTLQDCDAMIEASKNSNSICYLGFNMRHSPVHEKIYHLVHDGELGKITTIEANEWYYGGRTYFRRWNRFRKFGGGLWLTKACHDFDLITWIAGGNPISIYSTSSLSHYKSKSDVGPRCRDCVLKNTCADFYDIHRPLDNWEEVCRQIQLKMEQTGDFAPDICLYNSDKDTFDNGIAVINYDNDIRATYTVNVLAARSTRQMRIIGTIAMIEADMANSSITVTRRHTNKVSVIDLSEQTQSGHGGADHKIFSDFFAVCRNGGTPRSDLMDGRLAVQMSLAATQSCDNNLLIKISDM